MSIAQGIKRYRAENNLTQEQFAKLVGVTQAQVAMYESERRKPTPTARANMIALGFPEDEFTMQEGENLYMATDEQRDTAEQLVAICKLVVNQSYKLPSTARINALKSAIADYESALAKPDRAKKEADEA